MNLPTLEGHGAMQQQGCTASLALMNHARSLLVIVCGYVLDSVLQNGEINREN